MIDCPMFAWSAFSLRVATRRSRRNRCQTSDRGFGRFEPSSRWPSAASSAESPRASDAPLEARSESITPWTASTRAVSEYFAERSSMTKSAGLVSVGHSWPAAASRGTSSATGPSYAICPSAITSAVSNIRNTCTDGWWIVQKMSTWRLAATSRSEAITDRAVVASSDVVGSSQNSSSGLASTAHAIESFLRFAVLRSRALALEYLTRRRSASASSTRARRSSAPMLVGSRSEHWNSSVSRTVRSPTKNES
eukprot:Amastigsp_a879_177.p2 type:complete len:251 gc:universal Amastigsp_a879_177:1469-2221(+)